MNFMHTFKKHIQNYSTLAIGGGFFAVVTILALFAFEAITSDTIPTNEALASNICGSASASPMFVELGQKTTLTWQFNETGITVSVDQIPDQTWEGASGSVEVTPTASEKYRIIAKKDGAYAGECSAYVTVKPALSCLATNLSVSGNSFTFSGPPALSWYEVDFCDGTKTGRVEGSWDDRQSITLDKQIKAVTAKAGNCGEEHWSAPVTTCPNLQPDPTASFMGNPKTITVGQSSTLTWGSQNVTKVSIEGVGTNLAPSGSVVVHPTVTTTYKATFYGTNGKIIYCWFTVIVLPLDDENPTCTLTASPTQINKGQSTTLTWTSANASSAIISPNIGTVALNGSKNVVLNSTTQFVGEFTSAQGKKVQCSVTVTVKDVVEELPTCSMNVSPSLIKKGDSTTLTWTSANASSASISPNIGTVALNGSKSVVVNDTTRFVGEFTSAHGKKVQCSVTVTVKDEEVEYPTCTLSASPTQINKGQSTTLTWTSDDATSASISPNIGTVALNGSQSVVLNSTTQFVGEFRDTHGHKVTCTATVTVRDDEDKYPTCSMSISPSQVKKGENATLTWTSNDATSASISPNIGSVQVDGSKTVTVNSATQYVGEFRDEDGDKVTCSATVSIKSSGGGGGGKCINCDDDDDDEDEDDDDDKNPGITLGKTITKAGGFITLNQVPYTGFSASPTQAFFFWLTILGLSALIAYVVTRVHPFAKLKLAIEDYKNFKQGQEEKVVIMPYVGTIHTPVTPAVSAQLGEEILSGGGKLQTGGVTVIEELAHEKNILLSPEALRLIQNEVRGIEKEELVYLAQIFEKAKLKFPREDGWILLSKERTESLLENGTASTTTEDVETPKEAVSVPLSETEIERPHRVEQKMIGRNRPITDTFGSQSQVQTQAPAQTAPRVEEKSKSTESSIQELVAVFIESLINLEKKKTFDILRNVTQKGVDAGTFMTVVVRQLDAVYKHRIEGNNNPNLELAKKTGAWSNNDFETVLGILVQCVDFSYSNDKIGTKIALTKAFEYFERNNK
jgi:hypothetical protein